MRAILIGEGKSLNTVVPTMKLNKKKVELRSFKNLYFSEIDRAHGVSFPTVFSQ